MDNQSKIKKISTSEPVFDIRRSHFIKLVIMEYLKVCENRETGKQGNRETFEKKKIDDIETEISRVIEII